MRSVLTLFVAFMLSVAACQPAEAGPLRAGIRGIGRGVVAAGRFVRARRPLARLFGRCG